ncbi:hypothetical protein COP2_009133 [Malus domestica]
MNNLSSLRALDSSPLTSPRFFGPHHHRPILLPGYHVAQPEQSKYHLTGEKLSTIEMDLRESIINQLLQTEGKQSNLVYSPLSIFLAAVQVGTEREGHHGRRDLHNATTKTKKQNKPASLFHKSTCRKSWAFSLSPLSHGVGLDGREAEVGIRGIGCGRKGPEDAE